jgi:hypothetical protein
LNGSKTGHLSQQSAVKSFPFDNWERIPIKMINIVTSTQGRLPHVPFSPHPILSRGHRRRPWRGSVRQRRLARDSQQLGCGDGSRR